MSFLPGLPTFLRWAAMVAAALLLAAPARAASSGPETLVHLLDYIAVDYREAVDGGQVRDEGEYREMVDFAANVREGIAKLDEKPARASLAAGADALARRIARKAPESEVAEAAQRLRRELLAAYPVPVGPRTAPDLPRAKALYAEHCAGCHGTAGRGDGPLAKGLDPAPSDFTDRDRQGRRSIHGLYNTVTLGVEGTAMPSFAQLSEADRWALAYLAASWGADAEQVARGKAAWNAGQHRALFPNHAAVASQTGAEVASRHGDAAADVHAYLRAEPHALDRVRPDPITFARGKIAESVEQHAAGRREEATQAALAAYLEGFELAEASLAAVDAGLVRRIEAAMLDFRHRLASGSADDVRTAAARIDAALAEAAEKLSSTSLSAGAAAAASFVILLREGLEAILVVTALLAFLRRGGQQRAIPFLHAGWIAALLAGIATWAAATWLVEVSGARREVAEGVAALAAAAMLLYVGFWLHDKSHARAWQAFVMKSAGRIGAGAAWGIAATAFLAVYREVFETVLFYQALWAQAPGAGAAIAGGFLAAAIALAAITWAILRLSVQLPLGLFFGASGIFLAVLAVVLAGNGVAALQEAGVLPLTPMAFVSLPWLGIHPTIEGLATQAAIALAATALFALSRSRAKNLPLR